MTKRIHETRTCSIEGCGKPHHVRGWCSMHYARWTRHGDPTVSLTNLGVDQDVRFWAMVDRSDEDGCWLWLGSRKAAGYGTFDRQMAHRFAYELLEGPIPAGLELDHLCRTPACVNPQHLEPVTPAENRRREHASRAAIDPGYHSKRRPSKPRSPRPPSTSCPQGHPLSGDNLAILPNGRRRCRTCHRDRARARADKARAELAS